MLLVTMLKRAIACGGCGTLKDAQCAVLPTDNAYQGRKKFRYQLLFSPVAELLILALVIPDTINPCVRCNLITLTV
jgi:hypothetical protein